MKSENAKPDARTISYGTESASRNLLIPLNGMPIPTRDNSISTYHHTIGIQIKMKVMKD